MDDWKRKLLDYADWHRLLKEQMAGPSEAFARQVEKLQISGAPLDASRGTPPLVKNCTLRINRGLKVLSVANSTLRRQPGPTVLRNKTSTCWSLPNTPAGAALDLTVTDSPTVHRR